MTASPAGCSPPDGVHQADGQRPPARDPDPHAEALEERLHVDLGEAGANQPNPLARLSFCCTPFSL